MQGLNCRWVHSCGVVMWRELGEGAVRKPGKAVVGCAVPCYLLAAPEWPLVGEAGQGNG